MRAHVIADGIVSNTIEVDSLDFLPNLIDATQGGAIGDLWDGVVFSTPPAPPVAVPESVTMRQARLSLLGAGLLANVNDAIATMVGAEGDAARIEWEYSQEVQRNRGLVSSLGTALGLTDAQLDALFVTAAAIP